MCVCVCVCVCFLVLLSFVFCLLSCAAAACRPDAADCRSLLSLSLAAAAGRLCLCRCCSAAVLVVLVCSSSSRPGLWSLSLSPVGLGPWCFVTYDLPSLAKPIKGPLWREICPRGPHRLFVHMPGSNQMPFEALYAQVAQLMLVDTQDFLF